MGGGEGRCPGVLRRSSCERGVGRRLGPALSLLRTETAQSERLGGLIHAASHPAGEHHCNDKVASGSVPFPSLDMLIGWCLELLEWQPCDISVAISTPEAGAGSRGAFTAVLPSSVAGNVDIF